MAIYRIPIELEYTGGGPGVNVWHCRADDPADVQVLAGHLRTFYSSCASIYANGVTLRLGQVLDVATREPLDLSGSPWDTPISTGGAGGNAPQGLAVTVSWRTSQATRRGSGRTFLGPLNSGIIDTGGGFTNQPKATVVTATDTLVDASQAVLGGALGVYGYQNAVPAGQTRGLNDPRVLRDFTSGVVRTEFAMLRRRRD